MKFVIILFLVLVLALLSAVSIGYWIERPTTLSTPREITVTLGDHTHDIAAKLDSAGLIHSRRAFRWMARWRQIDRHLRPGKYRFEGIVRLSDILDALHDGRAVRVSVTIPEGWTNSRITAHLSTELGVSIDSLNLALEEPAVRTRWASGAPGLEGYLWPETYQFYWGVPAREVVGELLSESRDFYVDSLASRAAQLGLSRHQVLTLASLIEAEAADGNERRLISGVFHNRLREGWLLQCDPTVVFALGGLPPGRSLQRSDLDFDSPYNTYLYPGLPPGPICNPGAASIMAALYPDSTDAMYFVADGRGSHIFSRTLDQHNTARVQIKREQQRR
jgi:UPF0755 protein